MASLASMSILHRLVFGLAGASAICRMAVIAASWLVTRTILFRTRTGTGRSAGQAELDFRTNLNKYCGLHSLVYLTEIVLSTQDPTFLGLCLVVKFSESHNGEFGWEFYYLKSFCKPSEVNITDVGQIYIAVYDCVRPKLKRNDFMQLLCEVGGIDRSTVIMERSVLNGATPQIDAALERLASFCATQIKNRSVSFPALREFDRRDGLSGKVRHLCQESPIQ